jgi:predicted RNase H-like nuclease (RuvC/YqgF family)
MTPDEIIQLSEILKSSESVSSGNSNEFIYSLLAIVASNVSLFLIAGKRIMNKIVGKVVKTTVQEEMKSINKTLADNEALTKKRFNIQIEELRFLNKHNGSVERNIEEIEENIEKIEGKVKALQKRAESKKEK